MPQVVVKGKYPLLLAPIPRGWLCQGAPLGLVAGSPTEIPASRFAEQAKAGMTIKRTGMPVPYHNI